MALSSIVAGPAYDAPRNAAAAATGWRLFREPGFDFTFVYPDRWTAKIGCHGSRHCVALSDRRGSVDRYILAFEGFAGDLEQTATQQAIFRKTQDGWVAKGRTGDRPATELVTLGWHGLSSTVTCGMSDTNGVHPAGGDCLWVVVSNGSSSVVADTQGTAPVGEAVERSVQSLRFTR